MTATASSATSLEDAPVPPVVERVVAVRDRPTGLPYLPALDGLRAIAVLAVVAYHLGLSWAPGGFLGVDLFFVISGFLITSILVKNVETGGTLGLGNFYWRRAKRLLPALGVTLLAVGTWVGLVATDVVDNFRREVVAAAGYVSNWYLIANEESYFEAFGRPSPLRHLWSLAIEEQFYVVWPVALAVGLAAFRSRRRLAILIAVVATMSFVWMAILYEPFTDPSRVYYGTDTRLGGLLLGSSLALVWRPWGGAVAPGRRLVVAVVGFIGLVGTCASFLLVGADDAGLYRLGFLWVALFGLMAVIGAAHSATPFTRLLSGPTLVAIGRRSYAMYLVHWPIIVFTRPGIDTPLTGMSNTVLRLALIVAATEALHRAVEVPLRHSAFAPADVVRSRWWGNPDFVAGAVVVLLVGTVVAIRPASDAAEAAVGPQPVIMVDVFGGDEVDWTGPGAGGGASSDDEDPEVIPSAGRAGTQTTTAPQPTAPPATVTAAPATTAASTPTEVPPAPATTAPPATATPAPAVPPTLVLGDSVALGAGPSLTASLGAQVVVDAAVSRQFRDLPAIVDAHTEAGLPPAVVVHLGTNGNIDPDDLTIVMGKLAGVERVLLVNARVPRPWESSVNTLLAQASAVWPNATLVDWHTHSAGHEDWFGADDVHLTEVGIAAYVSLVGNGLVA